MRKQTTWQKFCHFYQYLFYRYYRGSVCVTRKEYHYRCHTAGTLTMAFLGGMNFANLLILLELLTGYGFDQIAKSKATVLMLALFFLGLNDFIFTRKKKYKEIIKKFDKENHSNIKGTILAWSVVFATFFIYIVLVIIFNYYGSLNLLRHFFNN